MYIAYVYVKVINKHAWQITVCSASILFMKFSGGDIQKSKAGRKGAASRTRMLTRSQRSEIARIASEARWSKPEASGDRDRVRQLVREILAKQHASILGVTKEIDKLLAETGRELGWTSMRVTKVQARFRELLNKAENYLEMQISGKKKGK